MKDLATSLAILTLVGGLLLGLDPERALAGLRVDYGGPVAPSIWYRIGGTVMLPVSLVHFILTYVSE